MAQTANKPSDEQVIVAYAVEIAIPVTAEAGDTDFATYGGEIVRDAIAGWGVAVVRIVHLGDPDSIFPDAKA
jgi:serine protease inhibitor ecotin